MSEKEYKRLAERVYHIASLYRLLRYLQDAGGANEEELVSRFRVSKENIRGKLCVSLDWGLLLEDDGIWKPTPTGRNVIIVYEENYTS